MAPSAVPDFVALGAVGGVSDIRALHPFLAPRAGEHHADAARAADAILRRATPDDVAWLERHRLTGSDWVADPWTSLRPADLGASALESRSPRMAVVALASMHPSGYVRQAAVRLLGSRTDGGEVPYLLLRVNDWVPEVRGAAESLLRARLTPAYAPHFVASLALVESLRGERRVRHHQLVTDIERQLTGKAAWPALMEALHSASAPRRRAAARMAGLCGDPVLVSQAAISADPVVATLGARAMAETWTAGALREVLPLLGRGPSSVRFVALGATCDKLPDEAEPHLRRALLDPSTAVRELARYRWDKLGLPPMDFAAFYRQAAASARGPALAVAARGLAETGTEPDGPVIAPFLRHASADVRAAAVVGLGRYGGALFHDALVEAMGDRSARVAAEAQRWVKLRLGRAAVRRRAT